MLSLNLPEIELVEPRALSAQERRGIRVRQLSRDYLMHRQLADVCERRISFVHAQVTRKPDTPVRGPDVRLMSMLTRHMSALSELEQKLVKEGVDVALLDVHLEAQQTALIERLETEEKEIEESGTRYSLPDETPKGASSFTLQPDSGQALAEHAFTQSEDAEAATAERNPDEPAHRSEGKVAAPLEKGTLRSQANRPALPKISAPSKRSQKHKRKHKPTLSAV